MRAVRSTDIGRVEIVEAPVPALKPGHVLVRTQKLAICGSDVRRLYHPLPEELPLPLGAPGHEVIGVVEQIDAETDVRPGDQALVLVPDEDAMADYFQVPAEFALPLPPGPVEDLLMAQQLGTVIYACRFLPNLVGGTAVVLGQGSAGLHWNAMLRRIGLRKIVGMDRKSARVKAGFSFGATDGIDTSRTDPVDAVRDLTGGEFADLVVVAAGESDAFNLGARLVRTGGRVQYFGVPHDREFVFDYNALFRKYATTHSTGCSCREPGKVSFRMALDLIARGDIGMSGMVTHRFPLERVAEAYELARTRDDDAIKVVVETA